MTSIASNTAVKIAAVAMVLVLAFSFAIPAHAALTESQIQSILSLLQSFGADASTVANVESSLRGQTPSAPSAPSSSACTFTRDLTIGSTGADVTCLQNALIAGGYSIPAGATGYFGTQTQAAVAAWQKAAGVSPTAGYFGPKSRAAFNLGGGPTTGPTTPAPGTGVVVSAGTQPAPGLAPQGALRLPFTTFVLTAGTDGPVTVNSVTVKKVGSGNKAGFDGVVLLDQDGNQIGVDRNFNANEQATIGEPFTIPAGQSRSFTIAGNIASFLTSYTGQAPGIQLIAVNTAATVTGSLPITGTYHTFNNTLTVGGLTLAQSQAYAANATSTSKEIGTTAYKTTGFSLTAGSAEDVRLKTLTFNQTGSVSTANDLANIKVGIDGTLYPVTVSADGKWITANLGASGVLIPKGNKIEVYVQYDIVGSNSANRTVIFHVDSSTDIYGVGEKYGYGVPVTGGSSGVPFYFGVSTTVTGSSVTTIAKSNTVPAQNIAKNIPNQVLGGFEVNIKGESITVQSLAITIATTGTWTGGGVITGITIVDENGTVVAGPEDEASTCTSGCTVTFTDAVTFKTGKHVFTVRGKVPSGAPNNATIVVSTNPSSGWTNARGEITGNSVSFSQGDFAMNTMTVKAGTMHIARASSPASQTVVAGGTSVLMANFQFDATQSGEDIRFAAVPVQLDADNGPNNLEGDYDLLTSCQLFDGSTPLNSTALNPTGATTTADYTGTITLDDVVTVMKGTVKTLGMRCNISPTTPANSEFLWDLQAASAFTFTGAQSGTTVANPTGGNGTGPTIVVTISTGSIAVSLDSASPSYKLASAGTTDVTAGAYKFRASNEAVNLTLLGLTLTNTASSSAGDIVKVSIYDGATKVGEAYFTGSNTTATSTLSHVVSLPKDTDKTLTVKVDLANIGVGQAATSSGHLLAIDFLNAEGTGAESGLTRQIGPANYTGSTVAGIRVMKSYPTVALDSLPSTGVSDGRLMRFKVTADAKGPVGITELNFTFATTSATLSNVNVFVFEDSGYSTGVSGLQAGGQFSTTNSIGVNWVNSTTNFEFTAYNGTASTTLQIPAGGTRYFEVRGTVTGATSGSSVQTTLLGASAFAGCGAQAVSVNPLCAATAANLGDTFIWSPNSTTTASRSDNDWTGPYGTGIPTNGFILNRAY